MARVRAGSASGSCVHPSRPDGHSTAVLLRLAVAVRRVDRRAAAKDRPAARAKRMNRENR